MDIKDFSIKNKLTAIMVIVTSVTLLLSCIVFIWHDGNTTTKDFRSNLDILSKVTGSTNPVIVVKAVERGLLSLRDPLMVARQRGINLKQLFS